MRIFPASTYGLFNSNQPMPSQNPLNPFFPHSIYFPANQALVAGIATKIIGQINKNPLGYSPLFATGCAYGLFSGLNKIALQRIQNSIDDATITTRTHTITHLIGSTLSWTCSYALLRYAYRHTEFPLFYLRPRVAILATIGTELFNYSIKNAKTN